MTPFDPQKDSSDKIKLYAIVGKNKETDPKKNLKRLAYLLGRNAAIMALKESK